MIVSRLSLLINLFNYLLNMWIFILLIPIYSYSSSQPSLYGNYTEEQLIAVAKTENITPELKMNALLEFSGRYKPGYADDILTMYHKCKRQLIQLNASESGKETISKEMIDQITLFNSICLALGSTGETTAIEFLLNETAPQQWDPLFRGSETKSLTSNQLVDALFRHYVFRGLLNAAVVHPELFDEIESFSSDYLRGTEMNVKSWLPEYKEKYFVNNPTEIPEEGFIYIHHEKADTSFFFLHRRIQDFFQKKGKLPDSLLDLTIPKGGEIVFIPADPGIRNKDQMLGYFYKQEGNRWTYMLVSAGTNGRIDLDPSRLRTGLNNESAKEVFNDNTDDIYSIATYIATQ